MVLVVFWDDDFSSHVLDAVLWKILWFFKQPAHHMRNRWRWQKG